MSGITITIPEKLAKALILVGTNKKFRRSVDKQTLFFIDQTIEELRKNVKP